VTAVAALACVLTACTGDPVTVPTSAPTLPVPPSSDALRCGDAIDVMNAPPSDRTVVLGVIALPTTRVLQASPSGSAPRLFAKDGLVVRVGARVVLRIGDAWVEHARIAWGNPGTASDQVRVAPTDCTGAASRWVAFAGGYYVDEPTCLPIVVESGATRQVVYIPVGAACH
jgi:hypothetical protein